MNYRYPFDEPLLERMYQNFGHELSSHIHFEVTLHRKDEAELQDVCRKLCDLFRSAYIKFERKSFDADWKERYGDLRLADEDAKDRIYRLMSMCNKRCIELHNLEYNRSNVRDEEDLKNRIMSIALKYDILVKIADHDNIRIKDLMEPFR